MFGKGDLDRIKLANMAKLAQRRRDAELQAGDPQANQAEGPSVSEQSNTRQRYIGPYEPPLDSVRSCAEYFSSSPLNIQFPGAQTPATSPIWP